MSDWLEGEENVPFGSFPSQSKVAENVVEPLREDSSDYLNVTCGLRVRDFFRRFFYFGSCDLTLWTLDNSRDFSRPKQLCRFLFRFLAVFSVYLCVITASHLRLFSNMNYGDTEMMQQPSKPAPQMPSL